MSDCSSVGSIRGSSRRIPRPICRRTSAARSGWEDPDAQVQGGARGGLIVSVMAPAPGGV